MRYGTVGTGWIADSFVEGAAIAGGWELTAVYSRDGEKGRAFAEKHGCGSIPVFTDLAEMAASSLIDAVYIASPNALHYEQSKCFLLGGKHVLCEKPITVTTAQLRELAALARSRGLVYMEAIMMRHLPAREPLRRALGRLGKISTARFDFSQLSSKYPALLEGKLPNIFNPQLATGCLMDLGIYCVYTAIDLFGRPEHITTSAGFLPTGADAYGTSIFDYADKQVILTYSKIGQSLLGSEILGDQGTLTIGSVSKLTDIKLTKTGDPTEQVLVGDVSKEQLMSGEARSFRRYAADPADCAEEIDDITRLAVEVSETMETMRRQAGIRFADDRW